MFKTKEQFAKAMIDGRVFKDKVGARYFAEWNARGELRFYVKFPSYDIDEIAGLWDDYDKITEVLPWNSSIPEQGVLCWVWDHDKELKRFALVMEFNADHNLPFKTKTNSTGVLVGWRNAEPVTLEGVKQYIAEAQ